MARVLQAYYRVRLHNLSIRLGFSIPVGVCGPGLGLPHYGYIVVSRHASIGNNCRIHSGVNIGVARNGTVAPGIGANVYIGPGAKLFGAITIGDNVSIGANAVVTRSFPAGVTIMGVPASIRGSSVLDKDSMMASGGDAVPRQRDPDG